MKLFGKVIYWIFFTALCLFIGAPILVFSTKKQIIYFSDKSLKTKHPDLYLSVMATIYVTLTIGLIFENTFMISYLISKI